MSTSLMEEAVGMLIIVIANRDFGLPGAKLQAQSFYEHTSECQVIMRYDGHYINASEF